MPSMVRDSDPRCVQRRKNRALVFLYTLHCAQYAIKLHCALDNWEKQQIHRCKKVKLKNKYPAKMSAKFPCKSMAFSSNTLFNAISVKSLRLRALSMQKRICAAWVRQIEERVKNTAQLELRKLLW